MNTEIILIDKKKIDIEKIKQAAQVIRVGGLVAFPTETVYGLGANALDEEAVKGIFKAKGRPSDNPLIVHVSSKDEIKDLVLNIPDNAERLMDLFWPGPLTLIMKKSQKVPSIITAGLDSVALRMPSHPVALALIRETGLPIAAPSANLSGKPSPTAAFHVISDLKGLVDIIIDSGNSRVGLESTVLDLTVSPPMILRPGGITKKQLEEVLGIVEIDPAILGSMEKNDTPRSPGMKYTHYSPKAEVVVVEGLLNNIVLKINALKQEYEARNRMVGILATDQTKDQYPGDKIISMGDRNHPETIAAKIFSALRESDDQGMQILLVEGIEDTGIGHAVMNRLRKAAGNHIIRA